MKGIDPYIFVSYLNEDPNTISMIKTFIGSLENENTEIFISLFMLIKAEYLMRTSYKIPKEKIIEAFTILLEIKEVVFDDESTLEDALRLWSLDDNELLDNIIMAKNYRICAGPLAVF